MEYFTKVCLFSVKLDFQGILGEICNEIIPQEWLFLTI
jgi:hypothetical protein